MPLKTAFSMGDLFRKKERIVGLSLIEMIVVLTLISLVTMGTCQRALKRGQLGALSKGASSTRRLSVIFMGSTLLLSLEMHRWRIGWQWIKHRELCNFSLRA
jgi:hypothetical protein